MMSNFGIIYIQIHIHIHIQIHIHIHTFTKIGHHTSAKIGHNTMVDIDHAAAVCVVLCAKAYTVHGLLDEELQKKLLNMVQCCEEEKSDSLKTCADAVAVLEKDGRFRDAVLKVQKEYEALLSSELSLRETDNTPVEHVLEDNIKQRKLAQLHLNDTVLRLVASVIVVCGHIKGRGDKACTLKLHGTTSTPELLLQTLRLRLSYLLSELTGAVVMFCEHWVRRSAEDAEVGALGTAIRSVTQWNNKLQCQLDELNAVVFGRAERDMYDDGSAAVRRWEGSSKQTSPLSLTAWMLQCVHDCVLSLGGDGDGCGANQLPQLIALVKEPGLVMSSTVINLRRQMCGCGEDHDDNQEDTPCLPLLTRPGMVVKCEQSPSGLRLTLGPEQPRARPYTETLPAGLCTVLHGLTRFFRDDIMLYSYAGGPAAVCMIAGKRTAEADGTSCPFGTRVKDGTPFSELMSIFGYYIDFHRSATVGPAVMMQAAPTGNPSPPVQRGRKAASSEIIDAVFLDPLVSGLYEREKREAVHRVHRKHGKHSKRPLMNSLWALHMTSRRHCPSPVTRALIGKRMNRVAQRQQKKKNKDEKKEGKPSV